MTNYIILGIVLYITIGLVYVKTVNTFVFVRLHRNLYHMEFIQFFIVWPLELLSDIFMAILCARE